MSNFCAFTNMVTDFLKSSGISIEIVSNLHDTSLNDSNKSEINYVYKGDKDLVVIDMDLIAKDGYRIIKHASGKDNIINTVDAFIINKANEWFFIEFKDSEIKTDNSGLKNNVIKKAYSNWYMLLDILYFMAGNSSFYHQFSLENPIKFAKEHIYYILVCSTEKNPLIYKQIKNHELIGEKYTPPFMQRLKDYMFKDAYVYTESFLERKFVKTFIY